MAKDGRVYIESKLSITKGCDAKAIGPADVCNTPVPGAPPAPAPYVNMASTKDLVDGSKTVKINSAAVMLEKSTLSTSTGNEPGSVGGLMSGSTKGECKALLSSKTVRIEAQGVVPNGSPATFNNKNTQGIIFRQQGVPPTVPSYKKTIDETIDFCEVCEIYHSSLPRGKSGSAVRKKGKIVNTVCKANGWKSIPADHPWYAGRGSIQVHHLISCEALSCAKWYTYCELFGYVIDDAHNGIALPSVDELACVMAVPLHRGNHDFGYCFDEEGNKLNHDAKPQEDDDEYLVYTDAVKQLTDPMAEIARAGWYCNRPTDMVEELKERSRYILGKLLTFSWTLREDARDYAPGGPGCKGKTKKRSCRSHAAILKQSKTKTRAARVLPKDFRLEIKE